MAEDWAVDVKKYASDADEKAIAGIVRHCGIALQKRGSSLVSFSDKDEVARVRDNFLKKKARLGQSGQRTRSSHFGCGGKNEERSHQEPGYGLLPVG